MPSFFQVYKTYVGVKYYYLNGMILGSYIN